MRDADHCSGGWCSGEGPEGDDDKPVDIQPKDSSDGNGVTDMNGLVKDDDAPKSSSQIITPGVLSVTVGSPKRFGNPVESTEDVTKLQESPEESREESPAESLDCTTANELSKLREMLKKVTVNEASLHKAIERLGGGAKGLKTVIEYIMYFQALKEQNVGKLDPDSFARGLEQLCLLKGQPSQEDAPKPQEDAPNAAAIHQCVDPAAPDQGTFDPEIQQSSGGAAGGANRQTVPMWQSQGQEEWDWTRHFVDPCRIGYMESPQLMGAFYPNFYCPYPPPTFAGYAPFNPCMQPMFFPVMAGPNINPTSADNVQAAAMIRASRKIRIARHRGHLNGQQQTRPPTAAGPVGTGPLVNGGQQKLHAQPDLNFTFTGQGQSTGTLKFLLHKELKPSDVSSLGRTVLPKGDRCDNHDFLAHGVQEVRLLVLCQEEKEAETHLPYLAIREGVTIAMEDFDTGQSWTFRYRFWPNNKSRMYILENTRDFMKAHNLQEGDLLLFYRNTDGSYVVQGKKSAPKSEGMNRTSDYAGETSAEAAAQGGEQLQKKHKSVVSDE